MITLEQLAGCTNSHPDKAAEFLSAFNKVMYRFKIIEINQKAMFLSQLGYETYGLTVLRESWIPTEEQKEYEHCARLGNLFDGDGHKFRGRGLIQIKGRTQYRQFAKRLAVDIERVPELVEVPINAVMIAGIIWDDNRLNMFCRECDIPKITMIVHGETNFLSDRKEAFNRAMGIFLND
jgi:putative chitinase